MNFKKKNVLRSIDSTAKLSQPFPTSRSDGKSVSESSIISKVPLEAAEAKESVMASSDYSSNASKNEDRKWCPSPPSNYNKYLPNYFHKTESLNLSQSRDGDSILRIVQSKNLQKAMMESNSPSIGKYSWNSDNGELSETTTSGYCSGHSEIATQSYGRNEIDIFRQSIFPDEPPVYSKGCNFFPFTCLQIVNRHRLS